MLIDSHCHLDFPEFSSELDSVIYRARTAGVMGMLTISTKLSQSKKIQEIAERFDGVWCSMGIHPHEAEHHQKVSKDDLINLTNFKSVIGIGETGLDYYYENSPKVVQQNLFRSHIQAARETGLPLIIHTREADSDTIGILKEEMEQGSFRGLIHCFSTSRWLAEQALSLGMYISISGIVTFKNANELRASIKSIPLDRLLVETDSPYLSPAPNRGKRNEPSFVLHTAKYLSELLSVNLNEICNTTTANFFTLFTKANQKEIVGL